MLGCPRFESGIFHGCNFSEGRKQHCDLGSGGSREISKGHIFHEGGLAINEMARWHLHLRMRILLVLMKRFISGTSGQRAIPIFRTTLSLAPLLFCAVALFYHLGSAALFQPDEGRNADKAREILLLNDWITPHTNFLPALDKPMFFYWLIAISYKLFGVSEFSSRLPSALAGFGCLILICLFAKEFLGSKAALWSGVILVSTVEFFLLSRIVILDMSLTLFFTLSLCAFYWAHKALDQKKKLFYVLMYAGMAVATLIKGPIGFIVPGMVIFSYIIFSKNWSVLREMNLILGAAIFFLIVVPWYAWAEARNPGYVRYFVWEENFLRYFTPRFNRSQPLYYFVGVLLVGFIPWSLLIPAALEQAKENRRDPTIFFLLLWAGIPFVFFSLSSSKLPHYILPVYPPLALLTGATVAKILADPSRTRKWVLSLPWLTIIVPLVLGELVLLWPHLVPVNNRASFERVSSMIPRGFILLTLLALIPATWASLKDWWLRWAFPFSCVALLLFLVVVAQTIEGVSQIRSAKELAKGTAALIGSEDQLVLYDTYPSSLPFYLRAKQPIWVVSFGTKSSSMGSFYVAEKKPKPAAGYGNVLLTFEEFARRWKAWDRRLLVFVVKNDLPKLIKQTQFPAKQLIEVAGFVLVSNR
jgi:4-amino-4-deoxy-L-arabinose transferase-like glycosyltransferase